MLPNFSQFSDYEVIRDDSGEEVHIALPLSGADMTFDVNDVLFGSSILATGFEEEFVYFTRVDRTTLKRSGFYLLHTPAEGKATITTYPLRYLHDDRNQPIANWEPHVADLPPPMTIPARAVTRPADEFEHCLVAFLKVDPNKVLCYRQVVNPLSGTKHDFQN
jgi:hypothetical protein